MNLHKGLSNTTNLKYVGKYTKAFLYFKNISKGKLLKEN